MVTSKTVYTYKIMQRDGVTLLEAQQWPWTVVQIVPVPDGGLDSVLAKLEAGMAGPVVQHDHDKSFVVIMICAGDQGGKYPERHLELTQDNHMEHYNAILDTMAQAAVWYKTNVIDAGGRL